ncbi:MAG: glycosyltransferase family 9 protein [Elusimicrobia bacterium]|nr:glycosyltransferase family 9 protein [Elusimicrobiota bacterium]
MEKGDLRRAVWLKARKLLCVRLDGLGDLLMTSPAIRALKEAAISRRVVLLASAAGGQAAPYLPGVDDCLVYDAPWMKAGGQAGGAQADLSLIERLRRENPYQLLTDWLPEPEPHQFIRHEVQRQLDLAASIGCYIEDDRIRLKLPLPIRAKAARLLRDLGVDLSRASLVAHPGASAPSRRYPPELFAQALGRISSEHEIQVILTGSEAEIPLVESIRRDMGAYSYSLAGKLNFEELAGVLTWADLLLSNNTGPVHVAAAVGTPIIDLYALTDPQHTPWKVPARVLFHDVPCKFCYKSVCPQSHNDCLRKIPPESIVEAARELLAESRPGAQPLWRRAR